MAHVSVKPNTNQTLRLFNPFGKHRNIVFMKNDYDTSPASRAERFKLALEKSGLKGAELARRLGLENEQNITNWKARGVSRQYLLDVSRELFVTPDWLDAGVETKIRATVPPQEYATVSHQKEMTTLHMVPVLGTAQLGDAGFFEVMDYPVGHGDGYVHAMSYDTSAYAVRVKGHSMRPRIKDGEYVVIEPQRSPRAGDEVLVRTHSGKCMVKELLYHRAGSYCLGSVNEEMPNIFVDETDVAVIHVVGGIYKPQMYFPD